MIIHGRVGSRSEPDRPFYAIMALKETVAFKKFAVINTNTVGFHKIINWNMDDYFSMDVKFDIGPGALMIREIL